MFIKKKRCITLFTGFTETLKNLREWDQYTKQGKLKEFYELLSDFKNHKSVTIETKNCKIELSMMSINFTINILMLTKKLR